MTTAWGDKAIKQVARALKEAGLNEDYDVRLAFATAAALAYNAVLREPSPEMHRVGWIHSEPPFETIAPRILRAILTRADEEIK